ncbi:MAG: hypothetical protein AVDCRST_MAG79-528, partial [uncultured Thermoleophilia bacterium]
RPAGAWRCRRDHAHAGPVVHDDRRRAPARRGLGASVAGRVHPRVDGRPRDVGAPDDRVRRRRPACRRHRPARLRSLHERSRRPRRCRL